MEILRDNRAIHQKTTSSGLGETFSNIRVRLIQLFLQVKFFGYSSVMDDYEKRKLRIFNQLNFFQMLSGLFIPIAGMLHADKIPVYVWQIACLPSCVSIVVLALTYYRKYQASLITYFVLYPFCTCIVYLQGMNQGIELQFFLYGILSVFFLKDFVFMLFTIGFSMVSFFILSIVLKNYTYHVEVENQFLYLLNKLLSLALIFYGLFLIKTENAGYQTNILSANHDLHEKNIEIEKQKEEIGKKAMQLEAQKSELAELNSLKNKLFSIIAHDLKAPMYALRNLFRNMHEHNMPAAEVKKLLPDVMTDLNYTIGLMENLLQWAKCQMQSNTVQLYPVEIAKCIDDVVQILRLQAEAKNIKIAVNTDPSVLVYADTDMIHLVLRNLISNAIKFTPENGNIEVGISNLNGDTEIYVRDSGLGISEEALQKIKQNIFYTTHGTSSEAGTGLGLMLCKEFITKNNGRLQIESEVGKGSTFSFTLPEYSADAQLNSCAMLN